MPVATSDLTTLGSALAVIGTVIAIARGLRTDAKEDAKAIVATVEAQVTALDKRVTETERRIDHCEENSTALLLRCAEKHHA